MNVNLPTHPDGNFYSIAETNKIIDSINTNIEELVGEAVDEIEENKYKIATSIIEANTDLNDITENGNYVTESSTVAATISNRPTGVSASFYMMVIHFSGNTFIQIFFSGSRIFCRRKTSTGFGNWYEYTGTQQTPETQQS